MSTGVKQSSPEVLRRLCPRMRNYGVGRAWIFGSRARGGGGAHSDWDLLVEFERTPTFDDYMGLKLMLEDELGAPVDVLSRRACPPRFLQAIEADLIDVA